jgi:hypothetical protein
LEREEGRAASYSVMCILLLLAAGHALAQPAPVAADARAIILRSAERDQNDLAARRNYTFLTTTEQRNLDAAGTVQKVESRTHEVLILYGRPYRRLIAKDGKPLPPDEDRKERGKMDKEISRREKESAKEKEKRTQEESRNLRQQREILREVADAFEFQVLGEEEVDGFATWVIQAEPLPGYRPRSKETKILPNFRGRLWITKDEYRWVRVDAEVVRRISIGLVLARLNPGTTVDFEQRRVHDEIWMPSQVHVRAVGRLALLKKFNAEVLVTYSDYRKFQSDSRITETTEVTPAAPR